MSASNKRVSVKEEKEHNQVSGCNVSSGGCGKLVSLRVWGIIKLGKKMEDKEAARRSTGQNDSGLLVG